MNDEDDDVYFQGEPNLAKGPLRCVKCHRLIGFVKRWWPHPTQGLSNWIIVDPYPAPDAVQSWVETEFNHFEPFFRHQCPGQLKPEKQKYQSLNWDLIKAPRKKTKKSKNQTEMDF